MMGNPGQGPVLAGAPWPHRAAPSPVRFAELPSGLVPPPQWVLHELMAPVTVPKWEMVALSTVPKAEPQPPPSATQTPDFHCQ